CDGLIMADNGLVFDKNSQNYEFAGSLTNQHCPKQNCDNDDNKISSAFIAFLVYFKDFGNIKNLDSEKLAEYAILWLGHKLNQKTQNGTTTLNDFYNNHIKTNSKYDDKTIGDSYNKINNDIKQKIKSMDIGIEDISNFYEVIKLLCMMDGKFDKKEPQCNTCLENAEEFYEKYEKLINALDINKGSSYSQLLYSLSNDYKNFEKKYNVKCKNASPLSACPRSSVTKSPVTECPVTNSPMTNSPVTECPVTKSILIPIAIIFVVASFFFGISYKYSLFGFRKRGQKQHLREKLKK
ncbi:putative yir3 protein, partial [Plasmodium yoelii yoelii]